MPAPDEPEIVLLFTPGARAHVPGVSLPFPVVAEGDGAGTLPPEVSLFDDEAKRDGAVVLGFFLEANRFCGSVLAGALAGLAGISNGLQVRHFEEYSANICASLPLFLLNSFSATVALAGLKTWRYSDVRAR